MAAPSIEQHPDIIGMRLRYEQAAQAPVAQLLEGLGLMTGLYLAISPWVLGFTDLPTLTVNNLIMGIAVALLATGFASAFGRTHGLAWVAPIIGVWTILAPWLVYGEANTTKAVANNVTVGAICVLLGIGAMTVNLRRMRR